jgi:hypothetical protein
MRSGVVRGAALADYEFPDRPDTPRRLSGLQGGDPVVLILARGSYCPKEPQFDLSLLLLARQSIVGYARRVNITTTACFLPYDRSEREHFARARRGVDQFA